METSEHALVDSGCGKSTLSLLEASSRATTATTGQTKVDTAYRQLKEMMLRLLASLIGSSVGAAIHAKVGCIGIRYRLLASLIGSSVGAAIHAKVGAWLSKYW